MPTSPPDTPTTDPAERALRRFVRARTARDGDAMKDAWAAFVRAEIPRIRGLISTFRHDALPNGRVPHEDRDAVVSDAFIRLRDGLNLEGASIGEARACVRQAATWAFQDYVRAHVRDDRRRGGSIARRLRQADRPPST
ncbi:MAG: hypothetical protein ITG02_10600, partial [Patulibacter sp.]|nr:hypothetical protein [Patulibacter sp.]